MASPASPVSAENLISQACRFRSIMRIAYLWHLCRIVPRERLKGLLTPFRFSILTEYSLELANTNPRWIQCPDCGVLHQHVLVVVQEPMRAFESPACVTPNTGGSFCAC